MCLAKRERAVEILVEHFEDEQGPDMFNSKILAAAAVVIGYELREIDQSLHYIGTQIAEGRLDNLHEEEE